MSFFPPIARMIVEKDPAKRDWLFKMGKDFPINTDESNFFAADNLITFGKILGFLKEPNFVENAEEVFKNDELHRSIIWRIYILSWSINQCKTIDGDMIEFGCYDCNVAEFLVNYCNLTKHKKKFYLYDIFDNPPTHKFSKHSETLFDDVSKRLKKYKFINIIKGLLPNSYKDEVVNKISFVHFDLNSAKTEIDLLKKIYDKISIGGHIVIDDYGWSCFEEQHEAHKNFFQSKDQIILELPTGQGLVIKRN